MREDLIVPKYEYGLDRVIEECAEVVKACSGVIQTICKLKKHGEVAFDLTTGLRYDNALDMLKEFHDVRHAMAALEDYYRRLGVVVQAPNIPVPVIPIT